MKYLWLPLTLWLIGCGNTEYVTKELKVEDRVVTVAPADIHQTFQGVQMDSLIVVVTPDILAHKAKIRTTTNIRTRVVTVDVVQAPIDTTIKDTTLNSQTTVIEKPGFFDNLQTMGYIAAAVGIIILFIRFTRR